jgi:RsiW-degrading membrane proteinase PrsW (M82 family)
MSSTLISILPGLLVCWLIYRADRYEREPLWAMAMCYGLGMLATYPAMWAEKRLIPLVGEVGNDPVLTFLLSFGAIAPVEEAVKWAVLLAGAYAWRFFNEPFDGIVYSVVTGMGFATMENVAYVGVWGQETALLRAFTAFPAHLVFAIAMGYYVGKAKFAPHGERLHWLLRALLVSLLLHGLYDFLVFQQWTKWLASLGAASVYLCLYYFGALFREHLENSPFKKSEI